MRDFPEDVKDACGFALYVAQCGETHVHAKPLRGFGGSGVLEIVENDVSGTYRAVYTVRLAGAVYVLHAFQKKSRRGIQTPPEELARVRTRLRLAEQHHAGLMERGER